MKDKSYEIAMNSKYGGYQRGLASMVYEFSDRKAKSREIVKKRARLRTTQTSDWKIQAKEGLLRF